MYQSVKIVAGKGGWGGPLVLVPTETRNKIVSVTGGGVHPLAAKIAEMTGAVEASNQELTALKARNWDLMQAVGSDPTEPADDPGDDDGYNGGIEALFEPSN